MIGKNEIVGSAGQNVQARNVHAFRIHLVKSLGKICFAINDPKFKKELSFKVLKLHIDQDFHDIQSVIGKFVCKQIHTVGSLELYSNDLMQFIKAKTEYVWNTFGEANSDEMQIDSGSGAEASKSTVNLTTRRNCVVWLNDVLQHFGKT
jgi:hypothetical protein